MKIKRKQMWMWAAAGVCMLLLWSSQAYAASNVVSATTTAQVNYVSSIDNVLYPSTSQFYTLIGSRGVAAFSIQEPTVIKGYLNWDTTLSNQATIWFSRDQSGIDLIDTTKSLNQKDNYKTVFLDPGTYYINYQMGNAAVNNSEELSSIRVGICVLGQLANSTEDIYASSYEFPNRLTLDKTQKGFLSTTSPVDYYQFQIRERSMVNVIFDFTSFADMSLGNASVSLRNVDNQLIKSQNYSSAGISANNFRVMLDKGTYYLEMKGATTTTTLNVSGISYIVKEKLSPSSDTKGKVKVNLTIPYDYSQILLVKGKISKGDIEAWNVWNTTYDTCSQLTGTSFLVNENATYTLRIRDTYGNLNLHYVKVANIDRTVPKITGVTNGKTYSSAVTIRFSDNKSGIQKATLNGKKITSGKKAAEKGTYTLKVWDKAGNMKSLKFYIKK